jgi:AraC-like DNA-binding protein
VIIQCPRCGERVEVNGLGRKRLNIPLKNICEALQSERSVAATARQLHCSQGYIFNILKAHGLKPRDIIERRLEVTNNEAIRSVGGGDPPGAITGGD